MNETMDVFRNVEIKGDRLMVSRDELAKVLDACIGIQTDSKANNDCTQWLIAAGYIEAVKDLLGCFESHA